MKTGITMNTRKQLGSFLMIGSLNTLAGFLFYAAFLYAGFNYPSAILLATVLGILFNFQTLGRFVFTPGDKSHFLRFVAVYGFTCLINVITVKLLQFKMSNLYIAEFIALIPAAGIAFVLNKFIVFKEIITPASTD